MKSAEASKLLKNANKRAKTIFYNALNSTLHNPNISAKKKFSILLKLMKNTKVSSIPPLLENDETVHDPKEKADLLNKHFASKSDVQDRDDIPPTPVKFDVQSPLNVINTSPIEVSKIINDQA